MRITNTMLQQATLNQVQQNMQRVADAQRKVSSGLRLQKASDDPTAAAGSMRTRVALRGVEQYRRNADLAVSRATREEDVLLQITEVLTRAKVLATSQSSETATSESRAHSKAEADQLFRQLVDLANTRFEDGHLFGGSNSGVQPYTVDESNPVLGFVSANVTGEHRVEIAEQRYLPTNHNAVELFEDTGVLQAVRDLATGLHDNDFAAVGAALTRIDTAFSGVQSAIGDIGARVAQLDLAKSSLAIVEVGLQDFRAGLEEVDFEVAATELVNRQTALQAAMLATSKVMNLSLADYLR